MSIEQSFIIKNYFLADSLSSEEDDEDDAPLKPKKPQEPSVRFFAWIYCVLLHFNDYIKFKCNFLLKSIKSSYNET